MTHKLVTLLAFVGFTTMATPATAQIGDPDVRCLILSKFFAANETDAKRKTMASVSSIFFLGRLDARLSAEQLKAQIVSPSNNIPKTQAGAAMTDCAKRFVASQQSLVNIGKSLPAPPAKK